MLNSKRFFSKLLLFGEYSIIKKGNALAVPYPLFEGHLRFKTQQNQGQTTSIDSELKAFAQFLKHHENQKLKEIIDVDSFYFDVGQGIYFNSSIPQGYGVGSSGALVAAVFDNYLIIPREKLIEDIDYLKSILSAMESHFHGASSGIDPLISFLGSPVKIVKGVTTKVISLDNHDCGVSLFIVNTGRPRRTEPLVNLFLEKIKSQRFLAKFEDVLIPSTDLCIDSFLNNNGGSLTQGFKSVSEFQYEHMQEMIPKLFQGLWREGLKTNDFYLKLCGAGGGGFILGLTKDLQKARKHFDGLEFRSIRF
jgi:mevalonate kinase